MRNFPMRFLAIFLVLMHFIFACDNSDSAKSIDDETIVEEDTSADGSAATDPATVPPTADPATVPPTADDTQVVLRILNYGNSPIVDQAIWDKFIADNPKIKIIKTDLSDTTATTFDDAYNSYISNNNLPELIFTRSRVYDYSKVRNLLTVFDNSFLGKFSEAAINPKFHHSGSAFLGVLPLEDNYSSVMYVNKKIFSDRGISVPSTYAQLLALKATLDGASIKPIMMAQERDSIWVAQSCFFSTIVGRFAGNEFQDQIKSGNKSFSDTPFINAINAYKQFFIDGLIEYNDLDYYSAMNEFCDGNAAILIDGAWQYSKIRESGKIAASDLLMVPLLSMPGEINPGIVSVCPGNGWSLAASISAGSPTEAAAKRLLEYLYSPTVDAWNLEQKLYVSNRTGISYTHSDPFFQKYIVYKKNNLSACYVLDYFWNQETIDCIHQGLYDIAYGYRNGGGSYVGPSDAAFTSVLQSTWDASPH